MPCNCRPSSLYSSFHLSCANCKLPTLLNKMSVLCMICKDKLLNYSLNAPSVGSLNQLSENVIIATACGHLHHFDCLRSYQEYLRKKFVNNSNHQNANSGGDVDDSSNVCPSCLTKVKEEDNRRIYLFEDHADALEKARMLERQENLEIYCHQLELHIQQLQQENDMMVNKVLSPRGLNHENFDTIVKNDRVQWVRKGDTPLSGVVLSIFKKEGKLHAKIRLDRKIRTTQRSNRLFSSFRPDKKQEITVPFDEIQLEKDVNANVFTATNKTLISLHSPTTETPRYLNRSSSSNFFPTFPSNSHVGSSTTSLPDAARRLFGISECINESTTSVDNLGNMQIEHHHIQQTSARSRPSITRSMSYSAGFPSGSTSSMQSGIEERPERPVSVQLQPVSRSITSSDASLDQQRDYVMITPTWRKKSTEKSVEMKAASPDGRSKHVTFADDHQSMKDVRGSISSSETPYANVPMSPTSADLESRDMNVKRTAPTPPPRPSSRSEDVTDEVDRSDPYHAHASISNREMPSWDTNSEFARNSQQEAREFADDDGVFELEDNDGFSSRWGSPGECFEVTLLALLYSPIGFDQVMMTESLIDMEHSDRVKRIIRERIAIPVRQRYSIDPAFVNDLKNSLSYLCSGTLDVEELLTILFEFIYKMPPFINYSMDMCDYLHQFFIDFTDKAKMRTSLELLEKSLHLQDQLKLEKVPNPVLILQIPHSDDGIIHYDALIPNLTISLDHLLESSNALGRRRSCYCDNAATLECKICSETHGYKAVLFCDKCKDLLEGIHMESDHELELSRIAAIDFSAASTSLTLSAIICLKDNEYSVFLKQGSEVYNPWAFINGITNDGKLHSKQLEGFGYWLESLLDKEKEICLDKMPPLLKIALKYSRVLIYSPQVSSTI